MRAERVASKNPTISIASDPGDIEGALRLVYGSYMRVGLIEPNPYGMRVTPYHLLGSTDILIAKHNGDVVCTATLVRDGKLGLPMEGIFGDEVRSRRNRGILCAEASCLADRRSDDERTFPLLAKLMSFTIQCAAFRAVQELLIAVHPHHVKFYERFLGFEVINDSERSYDAVCGNPAIAMSLDIPRLQMSATPAHRRVFSHPFELHQFWHQPKPASLLAKLTRIVDECSPVQGHAEELEPTELATAESRLKCVVA